VEKRIMRTGIQAAAVALTVFIASVLFGIWAESGPHTFTLGQDEIQRHIDAHMPHTVGDIRILSVSLHLADGRAEIRASAQGRPFDRSISRLAIRSTGAPRYDSWERIFYLAASQTRVERVGYQDGTPYRQMMREREAADALRLALERFPLYRLRSEHPGWVVRSALDAVEIADDRLVIRLTVWQVHWVFLAISLGFALLVALLAMLLRGGFLLLLRLISRK
jgi:hypothetical protein